MNRSDDLYDRARSVIPGGVNSPVRAFNAVGGEPVYVTKAHGARLVTADGHELIDYCCSWGPLILGHARAEVIEAVQRAAADGTSFGINAPGEVELAGLICEMVPPMDMVRLVNSGTEAAMTALRIARGFTGRRKLIKFDGCYHGHSDCMLVSAGSGLLTGGTSSSAGVPDSMTSDVFVAPYNDLDAVREIVSAHGDDLAGIILEPVAGNMGLVPPADGFLEGLRELTHNCGALLIFDEVITGFRFGPTTYGNLRRIAPDLTCLGKIIGGGMPIGAVGGRREVMESLAPLGPVYQAGTLSGNPVAVAAGLATLKLLIDENPYPQLEQLGERLAAGLNRIAEGAGVTMHCARMGSMFTPFFCAGPVSNRTEANACETDGHARFFHGMLERGVYLPPSQFELGFVSAAHDEDDVDAFLEAARAVLSNSNFRED